MTAKNFLKLKEHRREGKENSGMSQLPAGTALYKRMRFASQVSCCAG